VGVHEPRLEAGVPRVVERVGLPHTLRRASTALFLLPDHQIVRLRLLAYLQLPGGTVHWNLVAIRNALGAMRDGTIGACDVLHRLEPVSVGQGVQRRRENGGVRLLLLVRRRAGGASRDPRSLGRRRIGGLRLPRFGERCRHNAPAVPVWLAVYVSGPLPSRSA
jgi:hypothetical protein